MTLERAQTISCRNTYTRMLYSIPATFPPQFFFASERCMFRNSRLVFFAFAVNLLLVADETH